MMHDHLEGVTEMRPGNYALFDGFQAAIGSCASEQVAVSVMGTVVAVHPDRAILDLGALAMSKDPGPVHVDSECGFGQVLGMSGTPLRDVRLVGLSQEHGKLKGDGVTALSVGQQVRVVPNHSCLTMACFDMRTPPRVQRLLAPSHLAVGGDQTSISAQLRRRHIHAKMPAWPPR